MRQGTTGKDKLLCVTQASSFSFLFPEDAGKHQWALAARWVFGNHGSAPSSRVIIFPLKKSCYSIKSELRPKGSFCLPRTLRLSVVNLQLPS